MLSIACWCALVVAGPVFDDEYVGPAYAERGQPAKSITAWYRGEALLWAVWAGATPDQISWVFGPPLLSDQFCQGPVNCWYPELGITVHFPPRLFRSSGPVERVQGGIE